MSLDQWYELKRKTVARALDLSAHFNGLAAVAAAEGLRVEAAKLQVLALRPLVVAQVFLKHRLETVR